MKQSVSKLDEIMSDNNTSDLRLSFSRISSFIQHGPKTLVERKKINNQGIKMGALIDLLLFERIKFDDIYYVGEVEKPTSTSLVFANYIIENWSLSDLFDKYVTLKDDHFAFDPEVIDELMEVSTTLDLWRTTKDYDKRIEKLVNFKIWNYIYGIYKSKDKIIISYEEYDLAEEIVSILKTHEYTKDIFKDNIGNYYQFDVDFEYKGFKFKSILDIVNVDHDNKTIQLRDLKTGSKNESEFLSSVLKYYYYLQSKLYQIASKEIMKILQVEDYKLLPFEFVYISRYQKVPVIYSINETWEKVALKGFTTKRGVKYPGLDDTIDLIKWHWDNKVFNESKETFDSKGKVELNDEFVKISE